LTVKDISIVIVSYNTITFLRNCLKSILQQFSGIDIEVIVVDNASNDNSQDMVKQEFPAVVLIENKQNLGFAAANNLGIEQSSGRYVAIVNSDVIVLGDCLKQLINFMDITPTVAVAGPRILNPDKTLQPSCRKFPSLWNNFVQAAGLSRLFPKSSLFGDWTMKYWSHDFQCSVDALSGCFLMIRRQVLDKVGLLDERFFIYGEDLDWCRRFRNAGWSICFYPSARAIHHGGASSASAPVRWFLEMQKADLQYWKKHHGRLRQFCYILIVLMRHLFRLIGFVIAYPIKSKGRSQIKLKMQQSLACIQWLLHLRTIK